MSKILWNLKEINKENPLVVLMFKKSEELNNTILYITSSFIKNSLFLFIIGIILPIIIWGWNLNRAFIVVFIANSIINSLLLRGGIKNSYSDAIYQMIYTEEFKTVHINEEYIYDIIEKMNVLKGRMEFLREKMLYDNIVVALLLLTSILKLI